MKTGQNAINPQEATPEIFDAFLNVEQVFATQDFDVKLKHLVKLRASQINGCAFCVDMHTREARKDGETDARLDRLVVWRHVEDYSDAERAALAWTEALTELDAKEDYGPFRDALRVHFSEKEIGVLTSLICMINLWNRLQASGH